MPVYEFVCPECAAAFDKLVRHAAAVKDVTCPKCGSHQVKKKLSAFAVQSSGQASAAGAGPACAPGGT